MKPINNKSPVLGWEVEINNVIQDILREAEARAAMRVKLVPKGKADVLSATGRSVEPETNRVVTPAEIEAIKVLRKAAG